VIHSSVSIPPNEVSTTVQEPRRVKQPSTGVKRDTPVVLKDDVSKPTEYTKKPIPSHRRFHLVHAGQATTVKEGRIHKKKRYHVATFFERSEIVSNKKVEGAIHSGDTVAAADESGSSKDVSSPQRPQRKPGAGSRTAPRPLPLSMATPFDDPATLTEKMNAWTLDTIGQTPAGTETTNKPVQPAAKFKVRPKVPAKRIAKRDPELVKRLDEELGEKYGILRRGGEEVTEEVVMTDPSDTDDGPWIVEIYDRIRVPKEMPEVLDPSIYGKLVIDRAEDMRDFFVHEDDSDKDYYDSDDEDENG